MQSNTLANINELIMDGNMDTAVQVKCDIQLYELVITLVSQQLSLYDILEVPSRRKECVARAVAMTIYRRPPRLL